MVTPTPKPQFLTVRETADRLRLSESAIYRLVERGEVPVVRAGARVLIPSSYFDEIEASALASVRSGLAVSPSASTEPVRT